MAGKQNTHIGVAAIAGITIVELFALANGIDGTLLALSFTTLGAIAGVNLPKSVRQKLGSHD